MNDSVPTTPAAPDAANQASDTPATTALAGAPAPAPGAKKSGAARSPRMQPVLEQLAQFYPHLFGAEFQPLKRGIFQDLLEAHPQVFERDALKEALGFHTRSTRYLTA